AAAPGQVAGPRGVVPERRDHLQELPADRTDDVGQAEILDPRVAEADLDAEHLVQLLGDRRDVVGDEGDLAQAHGGLSYSAASRSAGLSSPNSARISSVCSPMRGGWRRMLAGVAA